MTSSLGERPTPSKVLSDHKMRSKVEILAGILPADQTRLLLADYREALQQAHRKRTPGTTLWLTPTSRSRRMVLDELLDDSLPVCFAPNIFTFEGFAEKLLDSTGRDVTPISDATKRTLLRGLIDRFRTAGELGYFEAIAHTPGFLDLVSAFISELKRDETWPEEYIRICREAGHSDKDRELGLLYERYQQVLLEHRLYDAEGRFWSARDVLSRGDFGAFAELSLVVVDGFADFTHTQHEILQHLSTQARQTQISLPLESPLERADLFAKSAHSAERIARLQNAELWHVPASVMTRPAFLHLARNLFADPRVASKRAAADGITIVSAIGHSGEVGMLVQRTKQLLLSGVPANEITIAFRRLDDYADLLADAFQDAGIPFFCDAQIPLSRIGVLKALHALLQLQLEDWESQWLLAVVGSNYFRPDWAHVDVENAGRDVARFLRQLKWVEGRASILRAAERRAARAENTESAPQEGPIHDRVRPGPNTSASALLKRLGEATERLRGSHTFRDWADRLLTAARELGLEPPADGDDEQTPLLRRDCRAWEALEGVLYEAGRARETLGESAGKIRLDEFSVLIAELLRTQSVSISEPANGSVLVLDAEQARHLETDYLFLAGLSESSFPRRRGEDCLYNESERSRLNERGLRLGHQSSRSQDEMLLFFRLVTRPRRELILSYPSTDKKGAPLFPSPYLTALESLFEKDSITRTSAGGLDPVPPEGRLFSTADLRARATMDALNQRPGLFRGMLERRVTSPPSAGILAAADAAVHRFHTRQFTIFEGALGHAAHVERLRRRFKPDYQFSATQLESYAKCPFRFFLSEILRIEPFEASELGTDYRGRGNLVHDVLAALHREVLADEPHAGEDLYARFRQLVDEHLNRHVNDAGLQAALARIEIRLLDEWGAAYAEQSSEYLAKLSETWDVQPAPTHLEVAFGDAPGDRETESVASYDSLQFGSGDRKTRVRGRIDRVDVGEVATKPVFNVIDYKTGAISRFDMNDVRAGRSLQLALYTLAVARLELAGPGAAPFQMGYWSIKETGFIAGLKGKKAATFEPLDDAVLQSLEMLLEETIPRLAGHIRLGDFPVYSQDPDCTGYCPFHTVCRVNQVRPLEEKLDKRFGL